MVASSSAGGGHAPRARHFRLRRGAKRPPTPPSTPPFSTTWMRECRILLTFFLLGSTACASAPREPGVPGAGAAPDTVRGTAARAAPPPPVAPEVWMSTGGEAVLGKITALNGDVLTFLPAPYWGVESRTFRFDQIDRIQIERPGRGSRAFVYTFTTVFTVVGLLAGGSARYDVDYESALMGSFVLGAGAGLIGALVGSLTSTRTHHVRKLNDGERRDLVWGLMGHEGPVPREEGA